MINKKIDENKKKYNNLEEQEINEIKSNPLFEDLFLSDEEIYNNFYFLIDIIDQWKKCQENEEIYQCVNDLSYHYNYVRDENNQLLLMAFLCPKVKKFQEEYWYLDNVLSCPFDKNKNKDFLFNKECLSDNEKITPVKELELISNSFKILLSQEDWHGFYIYGNLGVGKTYLSICMMNSLAKKNKKCCFCYLPEFVNNIKSSYSEDSLSSNTINNLISEYKNCDVLILDDIGSEFASEWFYLDYLLNILNHRLQNQKTTIFNSNLSIKKLSDFFQISFKKNNFIFSANRLIDRIKSLVNNQEFEVKGANLRYKSNL